MQILTKTLLIVIYPLLLLAWLVNLVLGRDRLRLHDVPSEESCWIERRAQPTTQSYFSEESCAEGGGEPSAARPLTRLSAWHRPPLRATAKSRRSNLQGIGRTGAKHPG